MRKIQKILFVTSLVIGVGVNSFADTSDLDSQNTDADLTSCLKTVLTLDEGRWSYMGTIARVNGTFRTYEATSIHSRVDENMWAAKSFGGDVGGDEESAEIGYSKLVGSSLIPIEDGKLNEELAVNYLSCSGPDPEGRYQTSSEYKIPVGEGTYDLSKNVSWYSNHGFWFSEDHYNEAGRIIARRSGVNTPADNS